MNYRLIIAGLLLAFGAQSVAAQSVTNYSYCLSVETHQQGNMRSIRNSCNLDLRVTYCWGSLMCQNALGTGMTDISANSVRTVSQMQEDRLRSLVAFACDRREDFQRCANATEQYFRNRNPDGPPY